MDESGTFGAPNPSRLRRERSTTKACAMPKKTPCVKRAGRVPVARAAPAAEPDSPLAAAPEPAGEPATANDQLVRLPQILDLAAAAPLALELLSHRGKPTVVDAGGIERPGAPCLQVLLAAIRTWANDGVPLKFSHCEPPLLEHLRILGIETDAFLEGA
jgi:chemotaxis protein CheX